MKKLIILTLLSAMVVTTGLNAQQKGEWMDLESWSIGATIPAGKQTFELKRGMGTVEFEKTNAGIINVKFNDKSSGRTVVRLLTSVQYPYQLKSPCGDATIEGGFFITSDGTYSVCFAKGQKTAGYDLKVAKKV